jgi:hypothetical protein
MGGGRAGLQGAQGNQSLSVDGTVSPRSSAKRIAQPVFSITC